MAGGKDLPSGPPEGMGCAHCDQGPRASSPGDSDPLLLKPSLLCVLCYSRPGNSNRDTVAWLTSPGPPGWEERRDPSEAPSRQAVDPQTGFVP